MTNIILEKPKEIRFNNFTAMRRFVIDEILRYENPYPYLTGLLLRTTYCVLAATIVVLAVGLHAQLSARARPAARLRGQGGSLSRL